MRRNDPKHHCLKVHHISNIQNLVGPYYLCFRRKQVQLIKPVCGILFANGAYPLDVEKFVNSNGLNKYMSPLQHRTKLYSYDTISCEIKCYQYPSNTNEVL